MAASEDANIGYLDNGCAVAAYGPVYPQQMSADLLVSWGYVALFVDSFTKCRRSRKNRAINGGKAAKK
jgi:hypothetical protein